MSHKSFMYMLENRGPIRETYGTPESAWKGDEIAPEIQTCDYRLGTCKSSLHNRQETQEH
jgi:hypothetical protein